ncbi:hypothetical protein [Nocardia jiangsuensis]|uniref:Uncharacterized protein n=1 Tax=Nocardia jiangsuensis TaxID=1691563 RepID=A0ABV8E366_9NOCA
MISLSLSLPEPDSFWRTTWDKAREGDPASIRESDLLYDYFGTEVEMIIGDVEFIPKRSFVPLADLALSFRWVIERISKGADASISFTENAEIISLEQAGENITVSTTVHPKCASIPRRELLEALTEFLKSAHALLVTEVPGLDRNPTVRTIATAIER